MKKENEVVCAFKSECTAPDSFRCTGCTRNQNMPKDGLTWKTDRIVPMKKTELMEIISGLIPIAVEGRKHIKVSEQAEASYDMVLNEALKLFPEFRILNNRNENKILCKKCGHLVGHKDKGVILIGGNKMLP